MWVCRLKFSDKNDMYTIRTKKFNVTLLGYPVSHYRKGEEMYLIGFGILQGEEENKRKFLNDLRKDARLKKLDVNEDFLTILASHPVTEGIEVFYNPAIINVKPVINAPDGYEYWEIASWDKSELMKMATAAAEMYGGKLLTIKQTKLGDIFLPHIMPNLSKMQKRVVDEAYQCGYYSYPRKRQICR